MHDNTTKQKNHEERLKTLERIQRNTRIAIVILVGYSIYDVISKDSGSDIVYAHKVKAKEFALVSGTGTVFGSWKLLDKDNRVAGLVIENADGKQIRVTANNISFLKGRTDPSTSLVLDDDGLHLFEQSEIESDSQE